MPSKGGHTTQVEHSYTKSSVEGNYVFPSLLLQLYQILVAGYLHRKAAYSARI